MDERIVVSERTIEVLRKVRNNAMQVSQKQKTLDDMATRITSDEAAIGDLSKGYNSLKSETERQERLEAMDKIGDELDELYALKKRLPGELNAHKEDLLYYRERLEDELWRALVESGQIRGDEDIADKVSDKLNQSTGDRGSKGAANSCLADEVTNPDDCRMQKARSLLESSKADLRAAIESFHYLDRLCEAQRQQFETGAIPEWHDISRTEFDVEQMAQKMEHTRELIHAEKAYSEAGRYAVEVGFIREDPDQSCHFAEDADDGACSGDRYASFAGDKDVTFIEHWREKISAPCSSPSAEGKCDIWEVDSVHFGEGCSTHAEERSKIKIDRWDEMREGERKRMRMTGNAASVDELLCRHLPALDSQGSSSASSEPAQQPTAAGNPRAGLWKPSFAAVKELMVSGQAAVARLSSPWSSHRVGED